MKGALLHTRQWRPFFVFIVLVCAVAVWVASASATSFAAEDDTNDGSLELNTDVIVNESVGVGAAGDFPIRGELFSEELSARSQQLREAADEQLRVVDTLTFRPHEDVTIEQHQALRAGLFESYTPKAFVSASEAVEDSSMLYGFALVAAVLLVLVAGVLLGRFWARRKRGSS